MNVAYTQAYTVFKPTRNYNKTRVWSNQWNFPVSQDRKTNDAEMISERRFVYSLINTLYHISKAAFSDLS